MAPPAPADSELADPSRRAFLSAGALVVTFSLSPSAWAQTSAPTAGANGADSALPLPTEPLPADLRNTPWLDAWIRVAGDGRVTVFTGKVELGQGIRTALLQVAAEELDVAPAMVELITADTLRTPDEGSTVGSHSMQDSGSAIMNAAANVRLLLTQAAAAAWGVAAGSIATTGQGELRAADGRTMAYGTLAATLSLHVQAVPNAPCRDPASYRTLGRPLPRLDMRAKLTGGAAYVQDLRLPGMLHARVVRGPSFGTQLKKLHLIAIAQMPGVQVVRRGAFTALVAEREWSVIQALKRLERSDFVRTAGPLPQGGVVATLEALPSTEINILESHEPAPSAVRTLSARYTRPWLYHGSIGPSCAVALVEADHLTVWTHSQGVFNARRAIADLLHWPLDRVRCIHTEGSGCYGHNGADDVAAEAALIAQALPGRPIRLQWMREQEFGWEPLGPGMVGELRAGLDDNHYIVDWHHELWSNEHNARPVDAGGVLVGADLGFAPPESKLIPMPEGGASRNSNPLYALPNASVVYHFIKERPLRVSALRSLGAYFNVFCIESMLDELAHAADMDPLELRLTHLQDERGRTVLQVAAKAFGWSERARGDGRRGCGMAFARYKNLATYCALFMQVEVDAQTGRIRVHRVVAAVDSGQVANPDGLRNQIEGGIVQSLSWSMHEAVSFDAQQRTALSWAAYPILRFADVPDEIEVHIVPRDGLPFLGAGEAAQGPTAAALANALADATGLRLRDLPLSPERVKPALAPA